MSGVAPPNCVPGDKVPRLHGAGWTSGRVQLLRWRPLRTPGSPLRIELVLCAFPTAFTYRVSSTSLAAPGGSQG